MNELTLEFHGPIEFPFQIECKKMYTAYAALKGLK